MILPDHTIKAMMSHRITPWDISNLNPASYDLQLGDQWIDISGVEPVEIQSGHITIYPATSEHLPKLVLATTMEIIDLPDNMYAMVKLKTTPCREGLGHPIADWVDPGFRGQLTLMLHAFKPITLYVGQRVCQLVFGIMESSSARPYIVKGHYMNQRGPTLSWREQNENEGAV